MKYMIVLALTLTLLSASAGESLKLPGTADAWMSDCDDGSTLIDGKPKNERVCSMGKAKHFKLKSIQEMVVIRFDAAAAKGRQVVSARLFMKPNLELSRSSTGKGRHMLRYIRTSTIGNTWEEGDTEEEYGPGSGACFAFADFKSKKPWAWPGSQLVDAIMGNGNTLDGCAEIKTEADEWVSVEVKPELIYALATGCSDGLCVMDGGSIALNNNIIHSVQAPGIAPYIQVELGDALKDAPAAPAVKAEPAAERDRLLQGAVKITISEDPAVFFWNMTLNGKPVERWRIKPPAAQGPTVMFLENLDPNQECALEVVAVSRGGVQSVPVKAATKASTGLPDPPQLATFEQPKTGAEPPTAEGKLALWAAPGAVKISPEKPTALNGDMDGDCRTLNAIWNGKEISLHGCRGEYVAYQLCVEKLGDVPLSGIKIVPQPLKGPGDFTIGGNEIELYRNWYTLNGAAQWQPSYCIPMAHGAPFQIPDTTRTKVSCTIKATKKIKKDRLVEAELKQQNQTVSVDVYIPKDAKPGNYAGAISVEADGIPAIVLPIKLKVYDFVLPDRLSFWPELNTYNIPQHAHDYYRLAHQHRCLLNLWAWKPALSGSGKGMKVNWDSYDRNVGPLVSGEAFKDSRRAGAPVECMYLPYEDGWPMPLNKQTYSYKGSWMTTKRDAPDFAKGLEVMNEHYMTAPYLGDALSQEYKDGFLAVEKQFIEHFKEKGWDKTEMQCFYQGKKTHRIDYGVPNVWWTTDEPYHWEDWQALQFFCKMWTEGRKASGGDPKIWAARGDISRPSWQGKVLDGIIDTQYGGLGGSDEGVRRMRILQEETGVKINSYGSSNDDSVSNTQSVTVLLNIYLNGGNAHLPWQTLGPDAALDMNDAGTGGGNALLVVANRFNLNVVGDMRLKAMREAQQIIEYLTILGQKKNLKREQLKALVMKSISVETQRSVHASMEDADALKGSTLKDWQISELRRNLAELILK